MKKPEAIVLEDTEVDPKAKVLVAKTRNINYTKVMSVIEVMHIKVHPDNDQWCVGQFHHSLFPLSPFAKDLTPPFFRSFRSLLFIRTQVISTAHVVSNVGWGLEGRLEQFGIHRFGAGAKKVIPLLSPLLFFFFLLLLNADAFCLFCRVERR